MLSYVIFAIFFLRKHLRTNTYDTCHTHFAIPTGIVALWAKRRFKIPFIVTSHGSDIPGYNQDRFTFAHHFTKPLIRSIFRAASGVTVSSEYLAHLIKEQVGNYSDKLRIIKNGIDANKIIPAEKKKIVLATGRLLPRKGFQYLIQAVSEKDVGYEVHMCGDGPLKKQLEGLAKVSKTKVVLHGWLNNVSKEYKELLQSAAIYCLPSSRENSSVSLLEAMSAGCAVITTNVSGCPETVGEAGILVPPADSQAISGALRKLIDSPELLRSYQERSRKRVLSEYGWDNIITEYENCLSLLQ